MILMITFNILKIVYVLFSYFNSLSLSLLIKMGKEIEIGEQSIQNIFKLHRNMEPRKLSYSGCKDM